MPLFEPVEEEEENGGTLTGGISESLGGREERPSVENPREKVFPFVSRGSKMGRVIISKYPTLKEKSWDELDEKTRNKIQYEIIGSKIEALKGGGKEVIESLKEAIKGKSETEKLKEELEREIQETRSDISTELELAEKKRELNRLRRLKEKLDQMSAEEIVRQAEKIKSNKVLSEV